MSIRRRLLEKGKIIQKVLIDVLTDHEERIAALEGNSQSEETPTPSEPSDDSNNDDDNP